MRGRRPDAVSQEAKGNPGKRRQKPTIADRVQALAEAPSSDPLAPPTLLGLEEFAGAIRVWHEVAPTLRKRNLLDGLDRHTLAMFCYYVDRWWSAVIEIAKTGETQKVKTVAGGYMLRDHPAVRRRDDAFKFVTDLSRSFGFTPLDRHKLIREVAGTGAPIGGLFGEDGVSPAAGSGSGAPAPEASDDDEMVGFARQRGGLPPGQRPN